MKRKVVVVIDEAHVFIDTKFPVALDFMFQLAKRIRKYNGMQIVITQNIKDFVGSEEIARKSTAIINACQYSFIFALSPNDIDDLCKLYEKAGGINEGEQEQITTAPRGQAFAIMSPSSRTTFRIEAADSVVQMFREPAYQSQYFIGEEGQKNWEDFIGGSRGVRVDNTLRIPADEAWQERPQGRKTVTFVELDEEELQAEMQKAQVPPKQTPAPNVPQETVPEVIPQPVVATVVQTAPAGDVTAQQLAKILGNFSFDAIRSEIDHRFEELRRDMEEKPAATAHEQTEPTKPAMTAEFQIETAKIPAPVRETEPALHQPDYSSLIIPDENEPVTAKEPESKSVDIMALLAAQAKKMQSISPIEMMELYGEAYTEVTLEELEKYINKNHK